MATLACAADIAKKNVKPATATRKERIFTFRLRALSAAPRLSVPRHELCPKSGFGSSALRNASLTFGAAQARRRRRLMLTFSRGRPFSKWSEGRNHSAVSAFYSPHPASRRDAGISRNQNEESQDQERSGTDPFAARLGFRCCRRAGVAGNAARRTFARHRARRAG